MAVVLSRGDELSEGIKHLDASALWSGMWSGMQGWRHLSETQQEWLWSGSTIYPLKYAYGFCCGYIDISW